VSGDFLLSAEVAAWLEHRGFTRAERVVGGRNNRMFRVWGGRGTAALKLHYRGGGDRRDRFGVERSFYSLARTRGVSAPLLLDSDEDLGACLLEWVDGTPVGAINGQDLEDAAGFLTGMNEPVPASSEVPVPASEACFATRDHLALLDARIDRLREAAEGVAAVGDFLESILLPHVAELRVRLEGDVPADFGAGGGRRILSPGDFGFHNAMRRDDGRLVFFDFEYSGWDDPAKTVADIFLQPESPVAWGFLEGFCAKLDGWPDLVRRVRAWVPFYAAKWAVILLGPITNQAAERRRFAGEGTDAAAVVRQQEKAKEVIRRGRELANRGA
jgi:hypothetical protein